MRDSRTTRDAQGFVFDESGDCVGRVQNASDPYVTIRLSPKAARFAEHACQMMADADLEDANDNAYYASVAQAIREALN